MAIFIVSKYPDNRNMPFSLLKDVVRSTSSKDWDNRDFMWKKYKHEGNEMLSIFPSKQSTLSLMKSLSLFAWKLDLAFYYAFIFFPT